MCFPIAKEEGVKSRGIDELHKKREGFYPLNCIFITENTCNIMKN